MKYTIFNREMKKVFAQDSSEVIVYVKEQIKLKRNTDDYHSLISDFLYDFGINSLDYIPEINKNKCVPYINCLEHNIFLELKGKNRLSINPETSSNCQKIMVKYLVSRLKKLNIQDFKNW